MIHFKWINCKVYELCLNKAVYNFSMKNGGGKLFLDNFASDLESEANS